MGGNSDGHSFASPDAKPSQRVDQLHMFAHATCVMVVYSPWDESTSDSLQAASSKRVQVIGNKALESDICGIVMKRAGHDRKPTNGMCI